MPDLPTACAAYQELRSVVAAEFARSRPPHGDRSLVAAHSLLAWHQSRCARLRTLSELLTVPRTAMSRERFLLGAERIDSLRRISNETDALRQRGETKPAVDRRGSSASDHGGRWRLDGDEFLGWLDQSRPAPEEGGAADFTEIPLPDLVAHVDSLHRYHEGQAAAAAVVTPQLRLAEPALAEALRRQTIHPYHRVAGVPHSGVAAPVRAFGRWLRQNRSDLLRAREATALGAEQGLGAEPGEVAAAGVGAPLVAVTCGQWDAGFTAAVVLSDGGAGRTVGAQALLMTDGDTDALLNAEESVQRWVNADVAHAESTRQPNRRSPKSRPFVHSACTADGAFLPPHSFCPPVDLAVITVPPPCVGIQVLPDPLLTGADIAARGGEPTAARLLVAAEQRALRQLRRVAGGHVVLLLHDWAAAGETPPLIFSASEKDQALRRAVLGKHCAVLAARSDVSIVHAECFPQAHVAGEVLRAADVASIRRRGALRLPVDDPFHFGAPQNEELPLHLDAGLQAAVETACAAAVSYLFVLRVSPGAPEVGADRVPKSQGEPRCSAGADDTAPSSRGGRGRQPPASAITFGRWGVWDALQGGVHWRDTLEYEHYTPKAGPVGGEFLGTRDDGSQLGDHFTGLWATSGGVGGAWCASEDQDLMAERRAAAAAVRAAEARGDKAAAESIRHSLDRNGRPMHRPAAAAEGLLSLRPSTGAAADEAAGLSPMRHPTDEPLVAPTLHSMFSESAKAARRRRAGRVAVKSDAAVERYLDERVLPRMRKVLAVANAINATQVPKPQRRPF